MLRTYAKINFSHKSAPQVIHVVQGDTGRVLVFELEDFIIPEGCAAAWYIQKRSGDAVYNVGIIDLDDNTVTVQLTGQNGKPLLKRLIKKPRVNTTSPVLERAKFPER